MHDGSELPIKILNGKPGYINFLDAFNSWQLVKELKEALGLPAVTSFKHVSPTSAAVGIKLSEKLKKACFVDDIEGLDDSPLACAYARARGTDRMSSFGDWIALSDVCDATTATLIKREISDGVIAPGDTDEALEILKSKRKGNYNIVKIDPNFVPDPIERKQVYGITFEQGRNNFEINEELLSDIVTENKNRWYYISLFLPLLAFIFDAFMIYLGKWKNGISSQYVFMVIFAVVLIVVLMIIPQNINSSMKAKELEVEKTILNSQLAESRISTMMSQIRPHFIYNTLGSIEQLCELDPEKAGELVHNFAKYLRGNFGELANTKPILMSQEMEHVHHYIRIENVRFPDMTFLFEMNTTDFYIPALSIQPIVENAIKHGLMKIEKGGTIKVISYETETHYCVSIEDDGIGFDTSLLLDEKEHMGLQNIRARLKAMVNGQLQIESTIGVGTKVLIMIPKEEQR
jgi:hypothetical protein